MKCLNMTEAKRLAIKAILLSVFILSFHCLAGINIQNINGPFSLDSTWPPQAEAGPCWSPDGTEIAFAWGDGYTAWDPELGTPNPDGSYIVIMTADGQAIRGPDNPLVNDIGWDNHSPDWSSDGGWIVYAKTRVGPAQILKIPASGGDSEPITQIAGDWHPVCPKWSPDGTKIAYLGGYWQGCYHIWCTDADGSTHEDLTPNIMGCVTGLSWKPDGNEIIFTKEGESDLFVLDVETKEVTTLPGFPSDLTPYAPAWACNGDSILFNASGGIYCYQINTQQTEQLTDGPDQLGGWHPTAGIVFSSTRGCTVRWDSNIYIAVAECIPLIEASINIDPDTLNLNSKGKWITCYIELPEGYDVEDIDVSTIKLNDQVPSESHPTGTGDCDNDEIPELMVKFDRSDVQQILQVGDEVEITVTGELKDGTPFEGSDTIRVIDKGGKK